MPEPLDTLQTPCLLLDEARLRANAERMRAHLATLGVTLRPHLKTAKSLEIGRIAMASPQGPAMWDRMRALKDEGLCKRIGVPVYASDDPVGVARRFKPDVVQAPASLLDQRLLLDGSLAAIADLGIEVHLRSIFLNGVLFLPPDRRVEARQTLRAVLTAPSEDIPPIETIDAEGAAIRWTLLPLTDEADAADAILLAGSPVSEAQDTAPAAPALAEANDDAAASDAVAAALTAAQAEFSRRQEAQALAHEKALAQAEKAERDLREALEAERRMANVGRLAGGVTQDFAALLNVMTSALDMLLRHSDDPDRVRRLGQAALTAGRRGEQMTRRLSAFSQDEDRTLLRRLDLGVLLAGLEGRLRQIAGPGVDLMIETPNQPAPARVDPVAFEAAVIALTRNAVEASNGAGSVAVRLAIASAGDLRLSVRDSGPGMDSDTLRRAPEPFFTTRSDAAGLGLSQAFAFARQASGALTVESAPGEGAEVAITLPLDLTPEGAADAPPEPSPQEQTKAEPVV